MKNNFIFIVLYFFLVACSYDSPSEKINDPVLVFTKDGAWCWFQDPRAVYISGQRKRTYAGWMTRDGKLQVGAYDHANGQIEVVTIKEKWGTDDHNNNSFLVLPDNRITIFYARHNETGLFSRTTLNPEDITKWGNEVTVANANKITYSHPIYLSDEHRFYVFWRGDSQKPTFSTSTDGINWTTPQILLQDSGRESPKIRPYLKVVSDGKSEIHFAFTDGHPRDEPENSIYYLKYKRGKFLKANDTYIGNMINSLPIPHRISDVIYDGKINKVRSWVWDIALGSNGNPVVVYTRLPKETDHRYHYAYWDGDAWIDTEITPGGGWFPQTSLLSKETEPYYSGGISIDHANPSILYLSKKIDKTFEIEKWVTPDHGQRWVSTAVTRNSKYNNVRPVVPRGDGYTESVLWMKGNYVHFTHYETGIYMLVPRSDSAQPDVPRNTDKLQP